MSLPLSLLVTVGLVFVIAGQWQVLSSLANSEKVILLPLALQALGGAVALFCLPFVFEKRTPVISLKSFQASTCLGALLYVISGILAFSSLRFVPPAVVAAAHAMVPVLLVCFGLGVPTRLRWVALGLGVLGIAFLMLGSPSLEGNSSAAWMLVASVAGCSLAYFFSKKLFWIHSATPLNFWSYLLASVMLMTLSVSAGEWSGGSWVPFQLPEVLHWGGTYATKLVLVSVIGGGLGAYLYRFVAFRTDSIRMKFITLGVPLVTLGINFLLPMGKEIPPLPNSAWVVIGTVLVIASLWLGSRHQPASTWMCHYLNNSRRQGDRVLCHLTGFAKGTKSTISKVEVFDLSIGGMGIRLDTFYSVNDSLVISLPLGLGGWTQISVECKVVHITKSTHKQLPWLAGMSFLKVDDDKLQMLVEFLAHLGKGERDRDHVGVDQKIHHIPTI